MMLRQLLSHLRPPTAPPPAAAAAAAASTPSFTTALRLEHIDGQQKTTGGSRLVLADGIDSGSDVKIREVFEHREHVDPEADWDDTITEVAEFAVTMLITAPDGERYVSAFQNVRQPIIPPRDFGPRPSLSLFCMSSDGQQAMARLFLDAATVPLVAPDLGGPFLESGGANLVEGDPFSLYVGGYIHV
jgi:hypothetical protein